MDYGHNAVLSPGAHGSVWFGAIQWKRNGSWFTPWRVNPNDSELPELPGLAAAAESAAGVRAEFHSDATLLRLHIHRVEAEFGTVDLIVDGTLAKRVEVRAGEQTIDFELTDGRKHIELWLPQDAITRVGSLRALGAHYVIPLVDDRPRWLAYGSSITQCCNAPGPSSIWPSLTARELGLDLTCLGFSGQCFLDGPVARTIRDADADVISICAGINIYNRGVWGAPDLSEALDRFLTTILDRSHQIPIWLMSPVISPSREDVVNAAGVTLRDVRTIIRDAAASFGSQGVRYIEGLSVLGPDDSGLLYDGLHPNAEGNVMMTKRLALILGDVNRPGNHAAVLWAASSGNEPEFSS